MEPIPKELLIHSVILKKRLRSSSINGAVFEETKIDNVRFTFYQSAKFTVGLTQEPFTALLRYDYRNSTPKGVKFEINDRVVFEGKEFVISDVNEPVAFKKHGLKIWLR